MNTLSLHVFMSACEAVHTYSLFACLYEFTYSYAHACARKTCSCRCTALMHENTSFIQLQIYFFFKCFNIYFTSCLKTCFSLNLIMGGLCDFCVILSWFWNCMSLVFSYSSMQATSTIAIVVFILFQTVASRNLYVQSKYSLRLCLSFCRFYNSKFTSRQRC